MDEVIPGRGILPLLLLLRSYEVNVEQGHCAKLLALSSNFNNYRY